MRRSGHAEDTEAIHGRWVVFMQRTSGWHGRAGRPRRSRRESRRESNARGEDVGTSARVALVRLVGPSTGHRAVVCHRTLSEHGRQEDLHPRRSSTPRQSVCDVLARRPPHPQCGRPRIQQGRQQRARKAGFFASVPPTTVRQPAIRPIPDGPGGYSLI